jgi:hypothetical protein
VHIESVGEEELVTLTFANMKQGKNLVLPLNVRVLAFLLDHLQSYDGPELLSLSPDVPLSPIDLSYLPQAY